MLKTYSNSWLITGTSTLATLVSVLVCTLLDGPPRFGPGPVHRAAEPPVLTRPYSADFTQRPEGRRTGGLIGSLRLYADRARAPRTPGGDPPRRRLRHAP